MADNYVYPKEPFGESFIDALASILRIIPHDNELHYVIIMRDNRIISGNTSANFEGNSIRDIFLFKSLLKKMEVDSYVTHIIFYPSEPENCICKFECNFPKSML